MREDSAAAGAKSLLRGAARQLGTVDPVRELGDVLDESLVRPAGDAAYRRRRTLEPTFSEASTGTLAFDLLQQRIPRHVDSRRTAGLQLDLADDPTPQADDEHDTVVAGIDRERPKRLVEFEDDDRGGRDMTWQRALRYPGTVGERSSRRSVS